jgi:hypothetical protein
MLMAAHRNCGGPTLRFPNLLRTRIPTTAIRFLGHALLAAALLAPTSSAADDTTASSEIPVLAGESASSPVEPGEEAPNAIAAETTVPAVPEASTDRHPAAADAALDAPAVPAAEAVPAAAAKIAPSHTTQPRWVPLDVGNQWTYVYLRERERGLDGVAPDLESFRGTLVEEVVGNVPEYSPRAVEVRSTVRGHMEGSSSETIQKHRSFVESNGFSYRVLATEAENPVAGNIELKRFTPPLLALKADANVGEKWRIGSRETGGLPTELEGEVLGVQDAKVPSGVFEKCLVVRYTGSFSGAIEISGNRIEVPSGEIVTTEWYAPGVGKVLAKEEIRQTMVLADGSALSYTERTQFALSSQKSGGKTPGD